MVNTEAVTIDLRRRIGPLIRNLASNAYDAFVPLASDNKYATFTAASTQCPEYTLHVFAQSLSEIATAEQISVRVSVTSESGDVFVDYDINGVSNSRAELTALPRFSDMLRMCQAIEELCLTYGEPYTFPLDAYLIEKAA